LGQVRGIPRSGLASAIRQALTRHGVVVHRAKTAEVITGIGVGTDRAWLGVELRPTAGSGTRFESGFASSLR